jgi:uncharacterized C2H2 Zn-finger protein
MMGKLKARLSQKCPGCYKEVLARRLEGRYVNDRDSRVLIWECPTCERLWRESRLVKPKFKHHGVEQNG